MTEVEVNGESQNGKVEVDIWTDTNQGTRTDGPCSPVTMVETGPWGRDKDNQQGPQSDDICDEADGFITDLIKKPQGSYNPRAIELESWGPSIEEKEETEDHHDDIYHLLWNTGPTARWREGLKSMLKDNPSEQDTRRILVFLHSNAANGVNTLEKEGSGCLVTIGSAPKCLTCLDWMIFMEGLNFELTSPGAVRDIECVQVTTGPKTNIKALEGFCHFLKSMLDLSWTNLQCVIRLDEAEGISLFNILAMLCSGCGMDGARQQEVDCLESKYPYLIKCLGFERKKPFDKLKWQMPDSQTEFQCLHHALHGMFRPADHLESLI